MVVWLLWVYDATNNLNPLRGTTALTHGAEIFRLEQSWRIAPETVLNAILSNHQTLGRVVGDYYGLAHFVVTFGVLVWLWWRHPLIYRPARLALVATNVIGFLVFWAFPVAPPRMLPGFGFVDVVAVTHSVGAWSSDRLASQANEFAAMPSLHVAWALWSAGAVLQVRRNGRRLLMGGVYVLVTILVVLATANHYFLDVIAGVATGGAAFPLAAKLHRPRL